MGWLDDLPLDAQNRVKAEQIKRERALKAWADGFMPKRTAKRIVERCNMRIGKIAVSSTLK